MQHGKSTFAKLLVKQIQGMGFTCKLYNFAFALKREIAPLIKEKYGFDSFSEDPEEKPKFREEMILHGKRKRAETNGKYWVDIVEEEIIKDDMDFAIVGDWRYESEYRLIEKFGGVAIHITKWDMGRNGSLLAIPSDNQEENLNDPFVKEQADFCVNWTAPCDNQTLDNWCNEYVKDFIDIYGDFFAKS